MTEEIKQRFLTEEQALRKAVRERTLGYVTAAFGLVAGLAWNEAIQAAIATWIPTGESLWAKFGYAAAVTLVLVVVTTYLTRLIQGADETKKD